MHSTFPRLPKSPQTPYKTLTNSNSMWYPTNQLSNYVTHFLQPLVETLPSYILDSKHFLQLLESLPPLPENAILVNADVTSLYTNITHKEGIESVQHYMKLHTNTLPQSALSPHTLGIHLKPSLRTTTFSFMDRYFLQMIETAMGTKAAPPYPNLFMGNNNIFPCQKIPLTNHRSHHLQTPLPILWHPSLRSRQGIRSQSSPPNTYPILHRR